jgi:hypothetical protein
MLDISKSSHIHGASTPPPLPTPIPPSQDEHPHNLESQPDENKFLPVSESTLQHVMDYIRSAPVRTISFIPKKCRILATTTYTSLLQQVTASPQDLDAYALLMMFPKCCLLRAPKSDKKKGQSNRAYQTEFTMDRLKKWNSGQDAQRLLWEQLKATEANSSARLRENIQQSNIKRCKHLYSLHRFSDAMKAMLSQGSAAWTQDILDTVKGLFPTEQLPESTPVNSQQPPLQVKTATVVSQIRSFKVGSSGGKDGLLPQHLQDLLSVRVSNLADAFQAAITGLVNIALAGKLPAPIAPYITSAPVIPLYKKNGGIRPIAIGETFRRLVSKIAMASIKHKAEQFFSPTQLAFSRNGAESIIHATNLFLQNAQMTRNMHFY